MLITKCYPQKSNILKGSMAHHMLMRTWLLCLTKVGPLSPNNPMPKRDRHLYRWLNQPVFWAKSLQSQMFGYLFLLPHNIWYISQHNPSVYIPLCDYNSGVYNVYIPLDVSKQAYFCCHGAMSPDCTPSSCKVRPSSNVTPAGGRWLTQWP